MAAHHCRVTQAVAIAALNAAVDLVDAGTPPGHIILYTGAEPTHRNDAAGTEVATCALDTTAFGAASYNGTNHAAEASLTAPATDPHATGHAAAVTYFRICNAAGTAIMQGTCSATAGDDLVISPAAIISVGAVVEITTLVVSVPIDQA